MAPRLAERVLLVGLDAADWQLIHPLLDAGRMPHLARLVEGGTIADLATLDPSVCCLHWTSILTGHRAPEHGVLGPVEVDPAAGCPRTVRSHRRRVPEVAEILSHHSIRCLSVGWPASYPAAHVNGVAVADVFTRPVAPRGEPWPVPPHGVFPPAMGAELAQYRVHPGEIGLAELAPFVPAAADFPRDRRLAELARILAETVSVHGVTTALMESRPWDFCAVYFEALHAVSRAFMPYHPPRMSHVDESVFERFRHVVTEAYCFMDQVLGRLRELAGDGAHVIVVSDHGYHADERRPRHADRHGIDETARWHRNSGLLCLAGPGIRPDHRLNRAGPLDLAPTVLTLFGIPAGKDLPGQVLPSAFVEPPAAARVDSWSWLRPPPEREGEVPSSRRGEAPGPEQGYLVLRDVPLEDVVRDVQSAETYNLARAYLGDDRPAPAIPLLESLVEAHPGELRFQLFLAQARYAVGDLHGCRILVTAILSRQDRNPRANLLLAWLQHGEGKVEEALASLRRAETGRMDRPRLHLEIAEAYLRLEAWDAAERCLRRAMELDDRAAAIWTALCRAHMGQGRADDAVRAGERAVGLAFDSADAHLYLGFALELRGEHALAGSRFRTCLAIAPDSILAHAALAEYYVRHAADPHRATYHRAMARHPGPGHGNT